MVRELGLSPGHFKALAVLGTDESKPMRTLADALMIDASMVTWLVDRLEERGLVERRTMPTDRRVKTLMLTPYGIRTRERLSEALYKPPEDLLELDRESLETLRDQLRKLPVSGRSFWSGSANAHDPAPASAAAAEG